MSNSRVATGNSVFCKNDDRRHCFETYHNNGIDKDKDISSPTTEKTATHNTALTIGT
jgi:hypothetical protein